MISSSQYNNFWKIDKTDKINIIKKHINFTLFSQVTRLKKKEKLQIKLIETNVIRNESTEKTQ